MSNERKLRWNSESSSNITYFNLNGKYRNAKKEQLHVHVCMFSGLQHAVCNAPSNYDCGVGKGVQMRMPPLSQKSS